MRSPLVTACSVLVLLSAALAAKDATPVAHPPQAAHPPKHTKPGDAQQEEKEPPVSPEIKEDRRVVFRLHAPEAAEVQLRGITRTLIDLKKNRRGIWSVTVPHVDPGIYKYSFIVDGEPMIDPSNPAVIPEKNPDHSLLEISTETPLFYQWRDVPHGTVHLHSYFSAPLKRVRRLRVYTPPGYEADPGKRYPVLYLFHGTGDTEATWTEFGRAHHIIDNLLAENKCEPMLLVMPDGHADLQGEEGDHRANFVKFEQDVLQSVLPLVDHDYRTIASPAGRAVNGLSLGGMQALEIGINHADLFAWIGGMSAYVPEPYDLIAPGYANPKFHDQVKLLWMSIGKDDFLLPDAKKFRADLQRHGIEPSWTITEGTHEWTVWRQYLRDFAPLLFRAAPQPPR